MKKEKSELEWRKYWKNKAEKLQKENLMLKQRIVMNNCRRCGKKIVDLKLWCSKCKEKVDEELKGGVVRPLEYYFKWYLKHVKPKN